MDGGFSIYAYDTGSYAESSPRLDGGYSVYDYDSKSYSEVTPRLDGGFDVFDYGLGEIGDDDLIDEGEFFPDEEP